MIEFSTKRPKAPKKLKPIPAPDASQNANHESNQPTGMYLLDLTLPAPAENLACDEALLDWREESGGGEILRFWESPVPFVVVGYANRVSTEVNVPACAEANVGIFRRCSGGGAVLQGKGCLNYALILRIAENSPTGCISTANRFIMERNRAGIESAIRHRRPAISVRGHTDLAIGDSKFSGNSQRRRKNFLLFHGTFLLDFNLPLVGQLLRMPSKEPDYRRRRGHGEFLANLNLSPAIVKSALGDLWQADSQLDHPPLGRIAALAKEKYSAREWNFKF